MNEIEEIKARLNIEELISPHVELRRSGSSLKGLCPFHGEKTPSFYVFPSRGSYHCFGCGQGGDVFSWTQSYQKLGFRDALVQLATRTGVELPDERTRVEAVEANTRLYQVNEAAAEFFREQLKSPAGVRAARYLANRSISAEIEHAFGFGFAPDNRHQLQDALGKRGFTAEEMKGAGLVLTHEGTSDTRDRFFGRLMIPIRDAKNRITGFGGRVLDDSQPKYLNSPQTTIFDKSRTLFAIEHATKSAQAEGTIIIVEGYLDAIRAHAAGMTNVVASLGTSITQHQLLISSRLSKKIVIALDPDAAGQAAGVRAAISALATLPRRQKQLADSLGRQLVDVGLAVDLRIAKLPEGAGDPDDLIARDADAFRAVIDVAVPAFEFYFTAMASDVDRADPNWRQVLIDRILPVIREFPFAVGVQAAWIERLGEATGVQARLLQSQIGNTKPPVRTSRGSRRVTPPPPPIRVVRDAEESGIEALLQILLTHVCPAAVVGAVTDVETRTPATAELLDHCLSECATGKRPSLSGLSEPARSLAERIEHTIVEDVPESRLEAAIRLHLAVIRRSRNKRELSNLRAEMAELAPDDQEQASRRLSLVLAEQLELEHQLTQFQVVASGGRVEAASP